MFYLLHSNPYDVESGAVSLSAMEDLVSYNYKRGRDMIIISYDIKDDKLRTRFAKMLRKQGAIRLQFSVYEVNNTQRVIDNIKLNIEGKFAKLFGGADSVLIFDAPNAKVQKYGNAIHRDVDVAYL